MWVGQMGDRGDKSGRTLGSCGSVLASCVRPLLCCCFVTFILILQNATSANAMAADFHPVHSDNWPKPREGDFVAAWTALGAALQNGTASLVKTSLKPRLERWIKSAGVGNFSGECRKSLRSYLSGIERLDTWAIKMFDATGKLPSGILDGTFNDLGSYDECIEFKNASYCHVEYTIPMPARERYHSILKPIPEHFANVTTHPGKLLDYLVEKAHYFHYLSYRLGVCVPRACTRQELHLLAQAAVGESGLQAQVPRCETQDDIHALQPWSTAEIVSAIYLTVIISTVLIGTLLTEVPSLSALVWPDCPNGSRATAPCRHSAGAMKQFLESVSIAGSVKKLFALPRPSDEADQFTCLHGIRVFTIIWVIFGHATGWINFQVFRNSFAASEVLSANWFQFILHGSLSVDSFLVISGMLTTFVTLTNIPNLRAFNTPLYIVHRIWRLFPLVSFTLALTFLFPRVGSGPIWRETIDPVIDACKENWWTNLLFINHLFDSRKICLLHTWYVGCDLHFYVLSLVVIIPMIGGRMRLGWGIGGGLIAAGTVLTGALLYANDYPATLLYAQPKIEERLNLVLDFYIKPWSHIGAYIVGVLLGALLYKHKSRGYVIPNRLCWIGWVVNTGVMLYLILGIVDWNRGQWPGTFYLLAYGSLHRTIWALCIGWIIYACTLNGGRVNQFLSSTKLIPFARLTYAVYLIHPLVHWAKFGQLRERFYVSSIDGLYTFIPTLLLTYFFGMICSLLCESPFFALEKRLFLHFGRKMAEKYGIDPNTIKIKGFNEVHGTNGKNNIEQDEESNPLNEDDLNNNNGELSKEEQARIYQGSDRIRTGISQDGRLVVVGLTRENIQLSSLDMSDGAALADDRSDSNNNSDAIDNIVIR